MLTTISDADIYGTSVRNYKPRRDSKEEKMHKPCRSCQWKIGVGPLVDYDNDTKTSIKKERAEFRDRIRDCPYYHVPIGKELDFIRVEEKNKTRLYCPKYPQRQIK